jgi:hypothetical protein
MDNSGAITPKRVDAVSRQFYDELLVYDSRTDRAHCLNQTAAAVWMACDGKTTVTEMVRELRSKMRSRIDEEILWMALGKLETAGLLVEGTFLRKQRRCLSRREAMRKMGRVAAIALPVVTSMLVPTPAMALSCFQLGHPCTQDIQCCSNHCSILGVNIVCV